MIKILPLLVSLTATSLGLGVGDDDYFLPLPGGEIDFSHIGFSLDETIPIEFSASDHVDYSVSRKRTSRSTSRSSSSISSSRSSSSSPSSSVPSSGEDYFYSEEYGPFPLTSLYNVNATFTYELKRLASQQVIERIRLYSNGDVVSSVSNGLFYYNTGERRSATFKINIKDYMSPSGLTLLFEILNSSYQTVKAYSASFYPPSCSNVLATSLKKQVYESRSLGFAGNGYQMVGVKERIDFTGIGDYIDNDYYYRLDISRNKFLYPNNFTLGYKSINLRFNDSDYLFPHFTHQSNGNIVIPLALQKSGSTVNFRYKNRFYVNRKTLDISDTYQTNYISTSDFYLPINGLKRFNGTTLYLDIEELGADRISTSIPLRYELNRTILGTCSDGDYCIGGGNR